MKVGMVTLGAVPSEISISERLKLQIFQMHEYTREAGNISLFNEGTSIVSYASGPNVGIYIILLLHADEFVENYEDALLEFGPIIAEGHRNQDFPTFLVGQYRRIVEFPKLAPEQRLAIIILDDKKREILEYLKKTGIISKDDLEIWLKDLYPRENLDINAIFNLMMAEKMIKNVVLAEREMIILLQNITIARIPPPKELVLTLGKSGLSSKLQKEFLEECKHFHQNYHFTDENPKALAELLIDPMNYKILNILRKKPLSPVELQQMQKKNYIDIKKIERLAAINVVTILKEESGLFYCLKSDIIADKHFSEKILELFVQNYQLKSLSRQTLLGHLEEIKQFYLAEVQRTNTASQKKVRRGT